MAPEAGAPSLPAPTVGRKASQRDQARRRASWLAGPKVAPGSSRTNRTPAARATVDIGNSRGSSLRPPTSGPSFTSSRQRALRQQTHRSIPEAGRYWLGAASSGLCVCARASRRLPWGAVIARCSLAWMTAIRGPLPPQFSRALGWKTCANSRALGFTQTLTDFALGNL